MRENLIVYLSKHGHKKIFVIFVFNFSGSTEYLSITFGIEMPFGQYWFCCININTLFTAMLCSNLFILNMTFDRFYSIVRPHKAASFNTVKRAKITIAYIVLISTFVNIPHLFVTWHEEWLCLPFGDKVVMRKWYFQFCYWISFAVQYAIPFFSLLSMNGVIIYTLRKRMRLTKRRKVGSRGQGQGQTSKMKSSEMQMYIILLLVSFAILILTTPGYSFFLINLFYDFAKSPKVFAWYLFYINTAQKMHCTNHRINFFLYVISGQKFRTDLKNLFSVKRTEQKVTSTSSIGDAETNLSITAESGDRPDTSNNNKLSSEISGSVYV